MSASSTTLGKKQCDTTWSSLPKDVQLTIFQCLKDSGSSYGVLACVSRDWQDEFERYNFARIKLTPVSLADFGAMVHRNRTLVRYIWFCLELDSYDCNKCSQFHYLNERDTVDILKIDHDIIETDEDVNGIILAGIPDLIIPGTGKESDNKSESDDDSGFDDEADLEMMNLLNTGSLDMDEERPGWKDGNPIEGTDHFFITAAFQKLFSVLSLWEPCGDRELVLDISIYSPSDSEHWFKYLTFLPDAAPGKQLVKKTLPAETYNDPKHGWVDGFRRWAPRGCAIDNIFSEIMSHLSEDTEEMERGWWDQLPAVPAVTSLVYRQQNRRRWSPRSLARLFARFPNLQEIFYEPWREWFSPFQRGVDEGKYWSLF